MPSLTTERATLCVMFVDDGDLIDRLRTGDDLAFEELVEHHAAPLLAVTRRILHNEEEARDAVQETFVAAFRNIGDFQEESRVSTWLHRIAVNCALMKLRIKKMSIIDRKGWPLRGDVEVVFGEPIRFASDTEPAEATRRIEAAVAAL